MSLSFPPILTIISNLNGMNSDGVFALRAPHCDPNKWHVNKQWCISLNCLIFFYSNKWSRKVPQVALPSQPQSSVVSLPPTGFCRVISVLSLYTNTHRMKKPKVTWDLTQYSYLTKASMSYLSYSFPTLSTLLPLSISCVFISQKLNISLPSPVISVGHAGSA